MKKHLLVIAAFCLATVACTSSVKSNKKQGALAFFFVNILGTACIEHNKIELHYVDST